MVKHLRVECHWAHVNVSFSSMVKEGYCSFVIDARTGAKQFFFIKCQQFTILLTCMKGALTSMLLIGDKEPGMTSPHYLYLHKKAFLFVKKLFFVRVLRILTHAYAEACL